MTAWRAVQPWKWAAGLYLRIVSDNSVCALKARCSCECGEESCMSRMASSRALAIPPLSPARTPLTEVQKDSCTPGTASSGPARSQFPSNRSPTLLQSSASHLAGLPRAIAAAGVGGRRTKAAGVRPWCGGADIGSGGCGRAGVRVTCWRCGWELERSRRSEVGLGMGGPIGGAG